MQERQATIGLETFRLEEPFLVLATQNPIEQEGTYPLPEAQVDRFMLKVVVGYPSRDEERKIVDRMASGQPIPQVRKVAKPEDILAARATVDKIWMDEKVRDYLVDVARATRNPGRVWHRGTRRHDRSRGQSAGLDQLDEGLQGPRVPAEPRLRHAARCEERGHGSAAASRHPDVRSRSRRASRTTTSSRRSWTTSRVPVSASAQCIMLAKEVIQRVREIQVRTGRQVADVLAGQYVSVFKGRGIEFDEVRPYVPGDEIRTIDWKVTARLGEPYVKRFVEERQLTLMLMADISASQDFGSLTRSKREVAAELCALLAFSATFNDDKVGLTLFHGGIEQYIPARKGQKHALARRARSADARVASAGQRTGRGRRAATTPALAALRPAASLAAHGAGKRRTSPAPWNS